MDSRGHGLDHKYVHAGQDHEHIDSFFSRSLGPEDPFPTLDHETTTPVCIIGGGLAGLTTALGLAERGIKNPVVLEANRIGWGASGRNGGFVSLGYSLGPFDLIKKVGEGQAKELYQLTASAMKLIRERIRGVEEEICNPAEGILRISWFDEEKEVREYVEKMERIFDDKLEFWPREKIREYYLTDRYYDAYLKPRGLLTHCLKFTCHMGKLAAGTGATIYEKSPVLGVKKANGRWHVKTPHGSVLADQIVYCCSGYIRGLHRRLSTATLPVATYVLLTEPLGDRMQEAVRLPIGATDTRTSSNYYWPLPDGRLLWGGRVSMFHPTQEKLKQIMMKDLLHVYPQLKGIRAEVAWGGYMGYSKHKMPQIGKLEDGLWYCQGFGGHGMCSTTAGGEVVSAAIAEGDETYRLFEPFGLDYAGKPFGPMVAQGAYWLFQTQDKIKEFRKNR